MSNCPGRLATPTSVEGPGWYCEKTTAHDLSVSRTPQHVVARRGRDNCNPDSFGTLEWERNWTLVSHGSEGCSRARMKILRCPSSFEGYERTGAGDRRLMATHQPWRSAAPCISLLMSVIASSLLLS